MRQITILFILMYTAFICSCGGSSGQRQGPRHLQAGMKEIQKGTFWYNKGCYDQAMEYFSAAHEMFTASDQINGVAICMNNIGNIYRVTGDIDKAVLFFEEAYNIYSNINDVKGTMQALSNKAAVLIDAGRLKDAEKILQQVENITKNANSTFLPLLNNQGILLTKQKKFKQAEEILNKALGKTVGHNYHEYASVNFAMGSLMLETGRNESAVSFFKKALKADRHAGFYQGIAEGLAAIGSAKVNMGSYKEAADYFKRSIKIYALTGSKGRVEEVLKQLEEAAEKSDMDITVTKHFADAWMDGKTIAGPCN